MDTTDGTTQANLNNSTAWRDRPYSQIAHAKASEYRGAMFMVRSLSCHPELSGEARSIIATLGKSIADREYGRSNGEGRTV